MLEGLGRFEIQSVMQIFEEWCPSLWNLWTNWAWMVVILLFISFPRNPPQIGSSSESLSAAPCRKQGLAKMCNNISREADSAAGCSRLSEKHCRTWQKGSLPGRDLKCTCWNTDLRLKMSQNVSMKYRKQGKQVRKYIGLI